MNKKEFRKRLDEYITDIVNHFEDDISHSYANFSINIERCGEIIKISNSIKDGGIPFPIQAPLLLQNPQHSDIKPMKFQAVLDKINDLEF